MSDRYVRPYEIFKGLVQDILREQEGTDFPVDDPELEAALRWAYETEGQIPMMDLRRMIEGDSPDLIRWRTENYPRLEMIFCLEYIR